MRKSLVILAVMIFVGCNSDRNSGPVTSLPNLGLGGGLGWIERVVGGVPFGEITILGDDHFLIDVKSYANLYYDFKPIPMKWHEVSGEIRLVRAAAVLSSHTSLVLSFTGEQNGYNSQGGGSERIWDKDGMWQEFSFIVYAGSDATVGRLQLMPSVGSIEIRGLRIEERDDAFAQMIKELQKDIAKNYYSVGTKKKINPSVPDTLLAWAGTATDRFDFTKILRRQLLAMEDDDIVWAQESLNDLGLSAEPLTRTNKQLYRPKCESLRSVRPVRSRDETVTSWLEGGIAYVEPIGGLLVDGIRQGLYLDATNLEGAKAIILDLRRCDEPDWLALTERGRYQAVRALVAGCMADSICWARRVPKNEEARPWLYLAPPDHRIEIPVLVLIGPDTNGAAAMAAEVFKRTKSAVLVGEETTKLPACRMRHFVPWKFGNGGRRCVLYPAGVWESGDGTKLTGSSVLPDINWSADDTNSLISKCREVLDL